jgi:hypothetical protein
MTSNIFLYKKKQMLNCLFVVRTRREGERIGEIVFYREKSPIHLCLFVRLFAQSGDIP